MDLKTYLSSRRTIPSAQLSGPGPDRQQCSELLTLASRSPDHGKLVPWRFIVIYVEGLQKLGEFCVEREKSRALDEGRVLSEAEINKTATVFSNAPLVVVLVSTAQGHQKIPLWEQELAVGAVGMNLLHASKALGFSAQWLTGWMAYDDKVIGLLGVSEPERIAGFFHIGTAQQAPVERARPDITAITTDWPA
uniref:nitroreductase family protein n=1 Tax=Pararhizobium sp. IMCC3301 TaxID=3067904 RepID=UPI00274202AE|nr:nitroreductase [Pararhizobium sp. IMCC3301]